MMVEYMEQYQGDSFCIKMCGIIGNGMIYKSSLFSPDFWEKLTPEVVSTRIDDSYIEHYMKCKNKKISGFRPDDIYDIMKTFNPVFPNSHNTINGCYSSEDVMKARNVISKIVFDGCEKDITENSGSTTVKERILDAMNIKYHLENEE